ncbi:Radical SAM [uncultured Caudovirales phage]|uniref:Radical SAM n=1 Tax=uncultured Caudovirales phage TaxID=2100421 RepID=A0A6J5LDK6_9CAUD|nr:Radical SAM [uncultured Caudovirales phage]
MESLEPIASKVLLFSDFYDNFQVFNKTGATLRLAYLLRKEGLTVRSVHHCTSFTNQEIEYIIDSFSAGEPIVVCISTSFLGPMNGSIGKKNKYFVRGAEDDPELCEPGLYWGEVYDFLTRLGDILKARNIPTLMGGWKMMKSRFVQLDQHNAWGWDKLSEFVDYYVIGASIQPIIDFCNGKQLEHTQYQSAKVVITPSVITDFADCASTPLPEDCIGINEALMTEVASGCVFDCSFCDYKGLGKRKADNLRSYDSLKREIQSNYDNFKTRFYTLTDNMINDYDDKLRYLARIRDETGIDLRWTGAARLDVISKKADAQLFIDAGCAGLVMGIESMKKEVGPYIAKMTDRNKLIGLLNQFRDVVGDTVLISGSFITGLPTETREEVFKTYQWLQTDEGRNCIDSYTFTTLFIHDHKPTQSFKDYTKTDNKRWISPWGTYESFNDLANYFNEQRSNMVAGFSIPDYHNLGLNVEDVVAAVRKHNRTGFKHTHFLKKLHANKDDKINEYKRKVLAL